MPVSGSTLGSSILASQSLSKGAPAHVTQAVAEASRRTGVSFSYLMTKASTESGFKADAKAKTSSATGLYQFIDKTWLDMVKRHGAEYGLDDMASAITRRSDGSLVVADKAMRQKILDLRKDPKTSALMAAEYASDNKQYLEKKLGRAVTDTDLYLAHFLGAGGATKFLTAMAKNSKGSAAAIMSDAASANRNIFFSKTGQAKSLAQVYAGFESKFGDEPATSYADASVSPASKTVVQPGAVRGAATPFLTTYLLSALEAPAEVDRKSDNGLARYPGAVPINTSLFHATA